jgi:hypothetical protein
MLSVNPEARGAALELAELLEQRAERAGPQADQRLFAWETLAPSAWPREEAAEAYSPHQRLRYRVQELVRATEQREAEALSKAMTPPKQVVPSPHGEERSPGLAAAAVLLVMFGWWVLRRPPPEEQAVSQVESEDAGTPDGGTAELAKEVLTSAVKETGFPEGQPGLHTDLPSKPLPGQRRPEGTGKCRSPVQVAINGGCWNRIGNTAPPCDDDAYVWQGGCYYPVFITSRQSTSLPQEPRHGTP